MKKITSIILFLSIILFISIDLLLKHKFNWLPIITPTPMLHDIKSIAYMLAEALFIIHGVYFIKTKGFKKEYAFYLTVGIFMALTSFTMLYTTKSLVNKWLNPIRMDLNISAPLMAQKMVAANIYMIEGTIVKISTGKYKVTSHDVEMRQNYIEIKRNLTNINKGMYNTLIVAVCSILFGLLIPYIIGNRKEDYVEIEKIE